MSYQTFELFCSHFDFEKIKTQLVSFLESEEYENLRIGNKNLSNIFTRRYTYLENHFLKIRFDRDFGHVEARSISGELDFYQKFKQQTQPYLESEVKDICANSRAFAVLKANGKGLAFGDKEYGGQPLAEDLQFLEKDVKQIVANAKAFAALKQDGTCKCWGNGLWFAHLEDSTNFSNILKLYSTSSEFFAQKKDNVLIEWGCSGIEIHDNVREIQQVAHKNPMLRRVRITYFDGRERLCM